MGNRCQGSVVCLQCLVEWEVSERYQVNYGEIHACCPRCEAYVVGLCGRFYRYGTEGADRIRKTCYAAHAPGEEFVAGFECRHSIDVHFGIRSCRCNPKHEGPHPRLPDVVHKLLHMELPVDSPCSGVWVGLGQADRLQMLLNAVNRVADCSGYTADDLQHLQRESLLTLQDANTSDDRSASEYVQHGVGDVILAPVGDGMIKILKGIPLVSRIMMQPWLKPFLDTLLSSSNSPYSNSQPIIKSLMSGSFDGFNSLTKKISRLVSGVGVNGGTLRVDNAGHTYKLSAGIADKAKWAEIEMFHGRKEIKVNMEWMRYAEKMYAMAKIMLGETGRELAPELGSQLLPFFLQHMAQGENEYPSAFFKFDWTQLIDSGHRALAMLHDDETSLNLISGIALRFSSGYREQSVIGSGRYGKVYAVKSGTCQFALKVMAMNRPSALSSVENEMNAFYPAMAYMREGPSAASTRDMAEATDEIAAHMLQQLRLLLPVSCWMEQGDLYILMLRYPSSLEKFVKEAGNIEVSTLAPAEKLRYRLLWAYIVFQLCDQLSTLHSYGLLHNDLHVGNVLIDDNDGALDVVIADFGLTFDRQFGACESECTATDDAVGGYATSTSTSRYVLSPRTDIRSVAGIYRFLLVEGDCFEEERGVIDKLLTDRYCMADTALMLLTDLIQKLGKALRDEEGGVTGLPHTLCKMIDDKLKVKSGLESEVLKLDEIEVD